MKKYLIFLTALALLAPLSSHAAPAFNSALDQAKNKLYFNGPIYSEATDGDILYVGGGFSSVYENVGEGVLFDETTQERDEDFPRFLSPLASPNSVHASISDGSGGWYIGGQFSYVDGSEYESLVHILSGGTVDPNFDHTFSAGAEIDALALSSDGGTLYIGGSFSSVNETTRNNLAAFDTATGELTSFDPNMASNVSSMALSSDDATLYVGGYFTTVNGVTTRNRIAAFDTGTGTATSFNPNVNNAVYTIFLSPDDATLYAGGAFITVNGATTRNRAAAFDTTTGTATDFDPNANAAVYTILLNGSTVYLGGDFGGAGSINGDTARNNFATVDAATGEVASLDPMGTSGGNVRAITMSSDGNTIYIGGQFTSVNSATARTNFAEVDAATGAATDFAPNFDTYVYTVSAADGDLFIGGSFRAMNPVGRREVAAIDLSTYELTDFDPDVQSGDDDTTYALALSPDGATLYLGGDFNALNQGTNPRAYIGAVDTATGLATDFDPSMNGTVYAISVSSDGQTIYAAGIFSTVNGGSYIRNNVASFDTDGVATAFDASDALDNTVYAMRLSPDDSTLYLGGAFTGNLYALDASDGSAIDQDFDALPDDIVRALAISPDGGILYLGGDFAQLAVVATTIGEGAPFDVTTGEATTTFPIVETISGGGPGATVYASTPDGSGGWYIGGSFTHVGGVAQAGVAHILPDGTLDESFAPVIDVASDYVYSIALSSDGNTLYIGGYFYDSTINGTTRNGVAALNTSDGSLVAGFDPNVNYSSGGDTGYVDSLALSSDDSILYVGGYIDCVGDLDVDFSCLGTTRNGIAAFDTSDGSLVGGFDPSLSADAAATAMVLSSDDGTLYAVGDFISVNNGSSTRNGVAAFDTSTGLATSFDLGITDFSGLNSIALSSDGSILYVGGGYFSLDGSTSYSVMGLDTSNSTSTGFQLSFLNAASEDYPVLNSMSLSSDDSILYVGGIFDCSTTEDFSSYTGIEWCDYNPTNFAAVTIADGSLTSFTPAFNGEVKTISDTQGGQIYIGGSFTEIAGDSSLDVTRDHVGAFNTSDLSVADFSPDLFADPGDGSSVWAMALSSDGDDLYVAGDYRNGSNIGGLQGFDTATGAELEFSPGLEGSTFSVRVLTLSPDDSELYAAGDFKDYAYFFGSSTIQGGNLAIFSGDTPDGGGDDEGGNTNRRHYSSGRGATTTVPMSPSETLASLIARLRLMIQEFIASGGAPSPEMLAFLNGTPSSGYTRNLTLGDQGEDVRSLQLFLISQNKGPAAGALAGIGATGFFGPLTQAALAEFQASVGISPASGFFGPITRGYLAGR